MWSSVQPAHRVVGGGGIEGSLNSLLLSATTCRASSYTPTTEPALLIHLFGLLVSATLTEQLQPSVSDICEVLFIVQVDSQVSAVCHKSNLLTPGRDTNDMRDMILRF